MAFYHTYRPQNFDDLALTQEAAANQLLASFIANKVSHAYLFTGSHGTGKTSTARILAKTVNCLNIDPSKVGKSKNSIPCNECINCQHITAGTFVDVWEMDAASNRGIDEIRYLKENIQLVPVSGKKKVYIIDEVHMLTTEAFNALLKVLEEPPTHVLFVLCTTELHKVPKTIQSRCTQIVFQKPGEKEISSYLKKISQSEKIAIADDAYPLLSQLSGGAYRDAAKILEQLSLVDKKITKALVEEHYSASSTHIKNEFLKAMSVKSLDTALTYVKELENSNANFQDFMRMAIDVLRDELMCRVKKATAQNGLEGFSLSEIIEFIDLLQKAFVQQKNTPIPSLPLELAVMKYFVGETATAAKPVNKVASATKTVVQSNPLPDENIAPPVSKKRPSASIDPLVEAVVAPAMDEGSLAEAVVQTKNELQDEDATDTTPIDMDIDQIVDRWGEIIKFIKTYNASMAALMRSCKPVRLDGKIIVVETQYLFHKERIEAPKNRAIIEQALFELLGLQLKIKGSLVNTKLTNKNIENVKEVQEDDLVSAVQEIFGV